MRSFYLALIDGIFGVIIILLSLRIILKLLGASRYAPFTQWVYALSLFFMRPFIDIFHANIGRHGTILDISAIFALIIYSCFGLLIYSIFEKEYTACKKKPKEIPTKQTTEYDNDAC